MTDQIKTFIPKILLLAGVLALSACGGGGSSTTSSSTADALSNGGTKTFLQGQVADGYLDKAVVFLDLNGNKVLDSGEPVTNTGPGGRFKLQVPAADADKYAVVAQIVPGQTYDEDSGSRLTEPLTLEAPVGQYQFITPLTTLEKNAMDKTPGLTAAQAQTQVQSAFGLGSQIPLNTDYIAAEQSTDTQQAAAAVKMHQTAQTVAAVMTSVEADITANLGGTIPATRTTAVQALVTDVALNNATQIANALQTGSTSTPQSVANQVLSGVDATSFDDSTLTLYQQRLDEQNAVWDVTPPQITVKSPTAGQPAPVDTTVTVTFDEALDPTTIHADAVTLAASGYSVAGSISYDDAKHALTFTPASPLPADTTYTVTVSAGIADSVGNARPQPTSWSFTTIADIAPPAPPTF